MPQKTNLNISPYYDDFDPQDNFYRVLFKPGYPVQARELTTLQSILQNQIESFGSHMFKEGSMVIPGSITYDDKYFSVRLNSDHLGVNISLYIDQLIGKRILGQTSGITATIVNYSLPPSDGVEDITIYVKYLSSGESLEASQFTDGEVLIIQENITYGSTTINSGNTIASLIGSNATAIGSAVGLDKGVYFIRGTFVNVSQSVLILDPTSNLTSYRVGLNILEELITANDDSTLNDNARGFSNYAAPGADRLKISTSLTKKNLDDFDDKNFVELIRIDSGEVKKLQDKSVYSIIKDYFAKRTYEESGDYTLKNFDVDVLNSLNDGISNDGIYLSSQKTEQGNTPSEDLMCVKVSSGKAYVRGFDIDLPSFSVIDVKKPRDTKTISSSLVPFEMGNLIKVNNVFGTPSIGISDSNIIELHNERKGSTSASTVIGKARVYSFSVTDASYTNATTEWDMYVFDVQTYTKLTLSEALTASQCKETSYIRGLSSGASGFVVSDANSTTITLRQTSGKFISGERIVINESSENTRTIISFIDYNSDDIKSVKKDSDFTADTILYKSLPSNFNASDRLTISGGTATCAGKQFTNIKVGSIIRYQRVGFLTETFNKVSAVNTNGSLSLTGISTVSGVCDGAVASETVPFSFGVPELKNKEHSSLFAPLNSSNIASVDLSNSNLILTSQKTSLSTGSGTLTVNASDMGIKNSLFDSFDAEKYSIFYSDGSVEPLTSDQVTINSGGQSITITGLTPSQTVTLNATLKKTQITSKTKKYIRSEKVYITNTQTGISTSLTGLTTSIYYGTRVEDSQISLNVPDVSEVVAVYESLDSSSPTLDKLTITSGLNLDTQSIIGEKIIGQKSGAIAQLVTRLSSNQVEFVYLNSLRFNVSENVIFEESRISAFVQELGKGNYSNITNRFSLDKGQRNQYYDYSRIVRSKGSASPTRKLLIIFNYYDVLTTDGDIITVNSYDKDRFTSNVALVDNNGVLIRSTDTLDFRPRVSKFTSTTKSPFDFSSRSFTSTLIITPNESSLVGYSYYLPRIDKVLLNSQGELSVVSGVSADNPKAPYSVEPAMELATISLPAYLYDPKDATISVNDHKRYTMRDIGKLDKRIENLEVTTSLSLLELDTKTLQIQDADGFSRFKTGFFVDDFKNKDLIQTDNSDVKIDVDTNNQQLTSAVDFWSLKFRLALNPSINASTADYSTDLELLDPNVQKTGDLITLKYDEVSWIEQPLASGVENINPFNVVEFTGGIILNPSSDNWTRNIYVQKSRVEINTNQVTTTNTRVTTTGTSVPMVMITNRHSGTGWVPVNSPPGWPVSGQNFWADQSQQTTTTTTTTSTSTGNADYDYVESIVVSGETDPYMRSRNVQFVSGGLKPFTQHYAFMDDVSSIDIIPKLIEIQMVNGSFTIGEDISGFIDGVRVFRARVATPNHKFGTYNSPIKTYSQNPYDRNLLLPIEYSTSSTILNIDTYSLSEESITTYGGFISSGLKLVGETSNASATVSNNRLITDAYGDLIGCFFIRDPNSNPTPPIRIKSGERIFRLTASSTNTKEIVGSTLLSSSSQAQYSGSGIIQTQVTNTVQVRNPPPPPPAPPSPAPRRRGGKDPLAQSFTVDESGAFLTSVDLYFANKDPNEKVYVELRTVELGTPTDQLVQDYARTILEPSDITVSDDASVATNVKFPSPVYLQPRTEYALVILSPTSNLNEVWVGTMGQKTVGTANLPLGENVVITKQYSGGSLFKSQNGTIWTASQYQDLKFKLYKAQFSTTPGDVVFYNPPLRATESTIPHLSQNSIICLPRKLSVGITTTTDSGNIAKLSYGKKVGGGTVASPGTYGYVEFAGGPISGITTTNVGSGYSTSTTVNNVSLYTISGSGSGAKANVSFSSSGTLSTLSIVSNGNGYAIGDVLGITTSEVVKGSGVRISVSSINGIDKLYLTNVQGESIGSGSTVLVYNGSTPTTLTGVAFTTNSQVRGGLYEGNVFKITQYNHGMHSANNIVELKDIQPDTIPVKLTSDLNIKDSIIYVDDNSQFSTFSGISTTKGYLKINNEIIYYESLGTNTIGIGTRGVENSKTTTHSASSLVYKYEVNGVSLTKINTTHDMATYDDPIVMANSINQYKDLDSYYLAFQGRGSGTTQNSFISEKVIGGETASASQNYQFSNISPNINALTPGQTTKISAKIKTVSGTSSGGTESSFEDQGYESVALNKTNFLTTPRLICSEINESSKLSNDKSLTLRITLETSDANLSPVIDSQNSYMILGRNRLNNPISDYISDSRSNLSSGDPHSSTYISKRVDLKQPSTALKVLISACRPADADFRVLYKTYRPDSSDVDQSFILFPGYGNVKDSNLNDFYESIDPSLNSGKPDIFVRPSKDNEFLDYQFSADYLDPFVGFEIKIVMSSTNESKAVKFKDLRVIALA